MRILVLAVLLLLAGCDQIKERAGFPDPARVEADGKAIGGACRHAGRGLEDCYRLNPEATKSAIYAGWKEMTEYMAKNNIEAVEPTIPPEILKPEPAPKKKSKKADGEEGNAHAPASEKDAGH
ncbi:MAG: hypothetical protein PHD37_15665 [Gallionellaceae bacterium]|nr:hypothetical protein [Gallionellaceae bacterium]